MKKKKIGKAFSKPIILGDENILMQGEFLLQLNGDGSGKSLKKRVGNKVVDVFTGISQQEIDEMENELQTQEQILLNIDAVQTLTLRGGWNWVSIYLNVEDEDDDIFGQLQKAIGDTCTTAQIKIQDKASTLSEGEWTGYDDFLQNGVGIQILVSDSCSVTLYGHYVTKRQPSPSKSGHFEYAYPYPFESQFSSIFQDAEVGDKIETLGDPDDEDSRVAAIFDGTEWVSQGDYDFNTFTPGIYYVYTPYTESENGKDVQSNPINTGNSENSDTTPRVPKP